MGYALAAAARNRGASVLLISGPTHLQAPPGVETVQVLTASQMRDAVRQNLAGVDIVIAAAAVADFTIDSPANSKLRRSSGPLTLNLKPTVDILAEIGADKGGRYHVGFAAEVGDPVPSAREKLAAKNLDLVVANDVAARDSGFDVDTNRVVMIGRDVPDEPLPLLAKSEVAERILDRIVRDRASTTQPLIHSAVSAGP
jgi:phosphopantothenoylcysteine decarboxylase/phosphopantothenate--cysteine ligase